jgi:hypothetical protein
MAFTRPGRMMCRMMMSRTRCRTNSCASPLLVALLISTGLFTQVGLLGTRRPALATLRSCPTPTPEDVDPVDDTTPEDRGEREEESMGGESDFVVPSSLCFRRGVPGTLSLPTDPAPAAGRASLLDSASGHFLASGRELRYWMQSQLC